MADFELPQQEIQNLKDPLDNSFVIMDATNNTLKATVTAGGALLVAGSSGTFQVKDGDLAVPLLDLGSIAVGYDGTNYQFVSVDTSGKLLVVVSGTVAATQSGAWSVSVSNFPATQAVTQSGTWTVQPGNTANTTPWLFKLDQTGSNNDVDVISSVLPTGASTSANQINNLQTTQLVNAAGDAVAVKTLGSTPLAADFGLETNSLIYGLTTAGGGGYVPVKVNPSGTMETACNQSGTWNVNNISGTISLPTGASTLTEQQTQTTSLQLIDDLPHLDAAAIASAKGVGVLGSDGTNFRWLKLDSSGSLIVAAATAVNVFFSFGDITTAASTEVPVRRTAYTEQTSNAQRSMSSANANDTSAGTGARTVRITYYTATGTGPFTEVITMNGTTPVNTIATDLCYIEKLEVLTVGSTGSNVGIITLFAATAGGGGAIGTMAATNNLTYWTHHYVPTGKTMKVTGISVSHSGTTVGSGGVFRIKTIPLPIANQAEAQISDFVRLYGQSSTFARSYNSPVRITGPARVILYVAPETTSSTVYRGAIDFFEE